MKSLKLGNITKTLGLISAGAMLGIFLLAPLSVGASHDEDEELRGPYTPPASFVLKSLSGQNFSFTLVENGSGELEFVHVPPAPRIFDFDDDDD